MSGNGHRVSRGETARLMPRSPSGRDLLRPEGAVDFSSSSKKKELQGDLVECFAFNVDPGFINPSH